ncbi:MAG: copper resistance protein CopC [Gemmatimonadales bacterium]
MRARFLIRLGLPLLALTLVLGAWTADVRHNRLTNSEPAADSTVAAPREIRLWFSNRPTPRLSSIILQAADSSRIALGAVRATEDPLSITAPVEGALRPGQYAVTWRTTSSDGHVVRGRFVFRVRE